MRSLRSLSSLFPFLAWFKGYSAWHLRSDLVAGLTVALVLVPQSMAYAQLAGLPAYFGLYAAFLPPMVAALFGSSRQLATGPVAMVSLMTAASLEPLATAGSESFIAYAILLALMVGLFQFALGALRLGLVVNFMSHPVVNGFTNAGALIIASSQLASVFGVDVEKAEHHYETVYLVVKAALTSTHAATLALAILAFIIMIYLKKRAPRIPYVLVAVLVTSLISWAIDYERVFRADIRHIESSEVTQRIRMYDALLDVLAKKAEENIRLGEEIQEVRKKTGLSSREVVSLEGTRSLLHVGIASLKEKASQSREKLRDFRFRAVAEEDGRLRFFLADDFPSDRQDDGRQWRLKVSNVGMNAEAITFRSGGYVVGNIPSGLPAFRLPSLDANLLLTLFPMAVIISLLGFMEAISISKAMAARTGHRLDPNQELIGQGLANMVGAMGMSYPVSGSFSRSAVNLQAGAVSGLSSVFSSGVVVLTLLFFTPALYYLPQAVLAAIIMMAVVSLLNVRGFIHAWKAQWYDGAISVITLASTLFFAPHLDRGIMIGVGLSIALHLFRDMKPRIAILSKHPDGTYRNRMRFSLAQCRHIAVVRYEGSLFFANVNYLEEVILDHVASMPELKHILIVGNGINVLDASGEDKLSSIVFRLREAGYDASFSGLNDSVLDVMRRTGLYDMIGEDHLYRNATRAIDSLWEETHRGSDEVTCPLLLPVDARTGRSLPPALGIEGATGPTTPSSS
jgi:MFS superfamily sulfate permease-like transporter